MLSLLLFASSLTFVQAPNVSLQINGLPSDAQPSVRLTLPSGSEVTITDASTFPATETGTYRWTPAPVRAPGQIVDTIYEGQPGEATIAEGGGTLTVNYAPRGGTGMLWVATNQINEDDENDDFTVGTIRAFRNGDLVSGGISAPAREFRLGPRLSGGAVDARGNYYFLDGWDGYGTFRISPAGLASNGSATKISEERDYFAMDPQGNLWMGRYDLAQRIPAAGLASGSFATNLSLNNSDDAGFGEMVFNHAGDMIVVGNGSATIIPASEISRGISARREITFESGSLRQAAIDAEGNLWAADVNSVVIRIDATSLNGSGQVSARQYSMDNPVGGLAIDNEGGVWALTYWTGNIYRLAPGGSSFELKGNLGRGFDEFSRLTFNPPAVGTPLAQMPGLPVRQ